MHFTHSKQPPPISITGVCVNSVCTAMHTWILFCARLFVFDHHHHQRTLNIGGMDGRAAGWAIDGQSQLWTHCAQLVVPASPRTLLV